MNLWIKIGAPIAMLTLVATGGLAIMGEPLVAVLVLVLGLLTIALTRHSLAPLGDVTRVIEGIAEGDLQHQSIPDRRSDEIGRLAKSTNKMIGKLSKLSETAEELARGDIGITNVEARVLKSGRLRDADVQSRGEKGDLEESFIRLTNQMRRLTIQARIIARDDLNNGLLDDRIPGDLGESFGQMVGTLRTIADRAKDIADGNLTSYVDGDGDLTTAFNQMVTSLNGLVQRIVETALNISTASEEILVVLQDQELAASHQASGVEETQRTMETLLSSARKIADNSQTVFKSAEKTQANNRTVAERIGELKSHTARITEILEVIKSIADRSDLLALNASLEGMRAGEAGKGFTLVAAEMRRLAENIKESIGDIKELVSDIRESSLATVMATEDGSRLSERTTDTALQISLITQQQQSGTEQVTQSMEELSHLINQGVAGTRQVTTAAQELATASENLRFLVDEFEVVDGQDGRVNHPAPSAEFSLGERRTKSGRQRPLSRDDVEKKSRETSQKTTRQNATLTRSKKFAMRARESEPTPVHRSNSDDDESEKAVDTAEVNVDENDTKKKSDNQDAPTVEFSSMSSGDDGLFEGIAALRNRDNPDKPDSSGEFEAIAREIESTEIDTQAMDDEEESDKA